MKRSTSILSGWTMLSIIVARLQGLDLGIVTQVSTLKKVSYL